MSQKEDLLRTYAYGIDPYVAAIRALPAYQAELERTARDYTGRSWIESPFKWPKFTDDEFEARRVEYQAKYGTKISIPGFEDIVHWKLPTRISTEEMALHRYAKRRKLPSPLNPDQLKMLTFRKVRFLRSLAAPTPRWMSNIAAIQNALDNAEDALVTTAVLGRWAAKAAPRLLGRAVPYFGWTLLGADILNLANIFTWMRRAGNPTSCKHMELVSRNPFHRKAALARAIKMRRSWLTVGEALEILQTTDQVFGVGISLGGIVGTLSDILADSLETVEVFLPGSPYPTTRFRGPEWNKIANLLKGVWKFHITQEQRHREQMKQLRGSWILDTFKDDVPKSFHTAAHLNALTASQIIAPWWHDQDPISQIPNFPSLRIPAPAIDNQITRDTLEDHRIDPDEPPKWPHIYKPVATAEELLYTYSPLIKDSLQTYCLRYQKDYEGMIGAAATVEFTENMLALLSDDDTVRVGHSAFAGVAQQMTESICIMPPDTPERTIGAFADWIGDFERKFADTPKLSEFTKAGKDLGIDWINSFPSIAFQKVADLFPGWQAIQDQIGQLFIPD